MKRLKIVGLAIAMAMALTAFLGVSSASAAPSGTVLCEVAESVCAHDDQYPELTTLETSSKGTVLEIKYEGVNQGKVKCAESNLEVDTDKNGAGNPMVAQVGEWTMSKCLVGSGPTVCTSTPLEVKKSGTLSRIEGDDGLLSNPEVSMYVFCEKSDGSTLLDCTYGFSSQLEFNFLGGGPAQLVASNEPMSKSGKVCLPGTTAHFSATFTVDAPKPVHLAQSESAIFTTEGEEYPALLQTNSSSHSISLPGTSATLECLSSSLTGLVLQQAGPTISGDPAYSSCKGGAENVTLNPDGCQIRFAAGEEISDPGTWGIVNCDGSGMSYTAFACTYVFPPQAGLGPVEFSNIYLKDGSHGVKATMGGSVQYSRSGFCSTKTGTGLYQGVWEISSTEWQELWFENP